MTYMLYLLDSKMPYVSLRFLLNKLLWDDRFNVDDYHLTFIHRGASDDKKNDSLSIDRQS